MAMRRRTKGVSTTEPILKEGERIFLYEKGSAGKVVGIYESVKELTDKEQLLNGSFQRTYITLCLRGRERYFISKVHGCKVKPVIKKIV